MSVPITTFYQEKRQLTQNQIESLHRQINRLSFARLAMVLLGGALLFKIIQSEQVWLTLLTFFLLLIAFMWLVAKQSKLSKAKEDAEDELFVIENELNCLAGNANSYADGSDYVDGKHPYTSDLDVFGAHSLYHRINRAATQGGRDTLARWLSAPAVREEIVDRQLAIAELERTPGWCLTFLARLVFSLKEQTDFKKTLVAYLKSTHHFGHWMLRYYTKICAYIFLVCALLAYFYGRPFSVLTLCLFLFHLLLTMVYARQVSVVASGVSGMGNLLNRFGKAIAAIEQRSWQSTLLKKGLLATSEENGQLPVSAHIRELGKLINQLDYRLNVFVGALLNGIFLWDFKQAFAIMNWRAKYHYEMAQIFDEMAHLEALISLAFLRINDDSWTFPQIVEADDHVLKVVGIKHPLLPSAQAIANDYQLDHHHLALITGSNMAGKSTFLRTIGINMILAFCGAPVCARCLELSVMHVITYMRISDSLAESTSTFKAELDRLDMILKEAAKGMKSFFLIDEMLRGTNSVDKYLGSKAVIERLIQDQAVGMVATHDLQLAELEGRYQGYLKNYHFDIQVIADEMVFDYRLKDGACKIFNASMLLKKIGIDISL